MLIFAALLLISISTFHSVLGERLILQRINKADNLPKIWGRRQFTFRTIQATWHLVSALWLGLAAYLVLMQMAPEYLFTGFLIIFGVVFGALAIVPLVWSSGKHKSWIVFGTISILLLGKAYLN